MKLGEYRQAEGQRQAEADRQERIHRAGAPLRTAVSALYDHYGEEVAAAISRERWARWVAEERLHRAERRIDWLVDRLVRAGVLPEPGFGQCLPLFEQDDPEWSRQEHVL